MEERLVAPCGMNCNICAAYLAQEHDVNAEGIRMRYCAGCRSRKRPCAFLKKDCELLRTQKVQYCYECPTFPCERLSAIDRRYRKNFRMSEIENLNRIRDEGIGRFIETEEERWRCPECGGTICCHNGVCFDCSLHRLKGRRLYRWDSSGEPGGTSGPREKKGSRASHRKSNKPR